MYIATHSDTDNDHVCTLQHTLTMTMYVHCNTLWQLPCMYIATHSDTDHVCTLQHTL